MGSSELVKTVIVQEPSNEYKKVEMEFKVTRPNVKIITIKRIQNPALYYQYVVKRHAMKYKNSTLLERKLFHGTTYETIEKINAQGFNRSFAGKNGEFYYGDYVDLPTAFFNYTAAVYGNGVYFAVKASYSACDTYSKPDSKGHKHMYLCSVLTGKYTQGEEHIKVPPPKDTANPADLFDSVVDKVDEPSMFIVFHDSQAYPEYLITFK